MKKFIKFFIIFAASNVFAQANNIVNEQRGPDDLVESVDINKMPIPLPESEIEKMQKNASAKATDGFSTIQESPEKVRSFFNSVNTAKTQIANQLPKTVQQFKDMLHAPLAHKDLSTLNLTFKPLSFNRGELIAAAPSGTLIDNSWTGVERFFRVAGAGIMRLTEYDLGATNGKFYMQKNTVNASVNGKQAISQIFTDGDNPLIEEITWVNGKFFYALTFGPDVITTGSVKSKANPNISAFSLAQELL